MKSDNKPKEFRGDKPLAQGLETLGEVVVPVDKMSENEAFAIECEPVLEGNSGQGISGDQPEETEDW